MNCHIVLKATEGGHTWSPLYFREGKNVPESQA